MAQQARRVTMMYPPIEELFEKVDSKFTLVSLSAKRARQINSYFSQLGEGLGAIVPPQVASVSRKPLSIESGRMARQANGAALVRCGDTMVLVTAVAAKDARVGIDFFPLTVDYQEKTFAAGKIPGGFFKREGRPTEKAILTARMIDRPIRPLWPKGYRNDVHCVASVISVDMENAHDILAIKGVEALVCRADIASDDDCKRMAAEAMAKWGRIDGLVNNAGTTKFVMHPDLDGLSGDDFRNIYSVNVVGPFQMTRALPFFLRTLSS